MTVFFLIAGAHLCAQTKVGTTIGQFLKIEPGARNAALGSAGAAMYGEVISAYHNPASLGRLPDVQIQFTHSPWLADINYNYLIAGIPLSGMGTLMVQITSLNSGEIDVRTVEQPLGTGERYSVTNFSMGMGFGKMLTDRISMGVQINYLRETIWHSSASGFALNIGVQYQLADNGPILGAAIANFGPRTGYNGRDLFLNYDFDPDKYGDNDQLPAELRTDDFPLPTIFRAGISYPIRLGGNQKVIVAVDAAHPNDNTESISFGGEWNYGEFFSLRGGYRDMFLQDLEGGVVLGAGLQVGLSGYRLSFDYAWADYGILQQTQRFTLGFRF